MDIKYRKYFFPIVSLLVFVTFLPLDLMYERGLSWLHVYHVMWNAPLPVKGFVCLLAMVSVVVCMILQTKSVAYDFMAMGLLGITYTLTQELYLLVLMIYLFIFALLWMHLANRGEDLIQDTLIKVQEEPDDALDEEEIEEVEEVDVGEEEEPIEEVVSAEVEAFIDQLLDDSCRDLSVDEVAEALDSTDELLTLDEDLTLDTIEEDFKTKDEEPSDDLEEPTPL